MQIGIDYFTCRLHPQGSGFDFSAFANWLEQERVDENTGQLLPPIMQTNQFRVKTMADKTVVVSFYGGAEPIGMALAKKHNLPVTRIDIAIDEEFSTPEEAAAKYNDILGELQAFREDQYTPPTLHVFEGRQTNKNGDYGLVLFTRSSPKQLSVYAKRDLASPGAEAKKLRYEWRLHSHIAKEIWPLVIKKYPLNKSVLFDIHQTLTSKFIGEDKFSLGKFNDKNLKLTKNPNPENTFMNWACYIVPKALYRHFKSTGEDLTQDITREFQRLLLADAEDNAKKVQTKNQAAVTATYHHLRKKLQNRHTLTSEDDDSYLEDEG